MAERKGLWVAFEGNDGSGKTTQVKRVADYLKEVGLNVIETREPGGNSYSEQLRGLIFNPEVKDDPVTQLLLFTAARRRNIKDTILPALTSGAVVLSDRSEGSTFAYQHFQFGLHLDQVKLVNDLATDGIKPNLTILLDVDEKVGLGRVNVTRGIDLNHFDQSGIKDWQKRRAGFLQLARYYKSYGFNPWEVIDANGDQEEVYKDIIDVLSTRGII